MKTFPRRYLVRAAAFVVAVVVGACVSSDKIPPKGSTVTVAANPATVPLATSTSCLNLLGVSTCGTADVVATVASELGVPIPDQDVRFSSSAGFLFTGSTTNPVNAANVPIRTDKFGNASVNLITSTTATVTAKSGPATGTLTINTVAGNLSSILLNVDTTSSGCSSNGLTVVSCNQTSCFSAKAVDTTGKGIPGVVIIFKLQNSVSPDNKTFSGQFSPTSTTTDSNGFAPPAADGPSELVPDSTCPTQCSANQNGNKSCTAEVVATTQNGTFQSNALKLNIAIP